MGACGYYSVLLLKESIQGKAYHRALGYTQVYWQDIPQLLENNTLRFDARREKVRLYNRAWLEQQRER